MDNVKIAPTDRSPDINFDYDANKFSIKGESYPEDVNEFFGPLMEQLETHFENQKGADIFFYFELIYFNSSTAKILMGLFDMFDETAQAGNKVVVEWCYEEDDDNMEELGEEYGEDLEHAEFVLKKIASE